MSCPQGIPCGTAPGPLRLDVSGAPVSFYRCPMGMTQRKALRIGRRHQHDAEQVACNTTAEMTLVVRRG